MSEKTLKPRIVNKHDIEANWKLATNFSPLAGEIIIYDPDENNENSRVKIGDGETNVNDLPFVTDTAKPTDLVVNMTAGFVAGKGIVYSCDTPFVDMWAAYESGGNVMFYIDGIHTSNVEFLIARADDAKSIHLAYINGSVYLEYTINEDDTVTWKSDSLITRTNLEETTGTDTAAVMSQKAVTDALALKADQTSLDEVSALVGDTAVADQISEAVSEKANVSDVAALRTIIYQDSDDHINIDRKSEDYMESNLKITGRDIIFTDYAMDEYPIIDLLNDKSDRGHQHDDRYFTESEINTKLAGYSTTSHTHSYLPLSGGTLTGDLCLSHLINSGGLINPDYIMTMIGSTGRLQVSKPADVLSIIGAAASSHTHDYAASSHNHSASNITSGTLPVGRGGTGSTVYKKNVILTCGARGVSSSFGYNCQYIPYLKMCFVRIYVQPSASWSADIDYEVATISSSTYYPDNMIALSAYAQKEVSAYINTEGKIIVRPYESVGTSYGIRLAGFWFCG